MATLLEEAQALFRAVEREGGAPCTVEEQTQSLICLVCDVDVSRNPHARDCKWVTVAPKIITTLKLLEDIVRPVNRLNAYLANDNPAKRDAEFQAYLESMATQP